MFIKNNAGMVGTVQEGLKVFQGRGEPEATSKLIGGKHKNMHSKTSRKLLLSELILQKVNPDKSFVLRVHTSSYAVAAALEQLSGQDPTTSGEDERAKKSVTVVFSLRKSTSIQSK